MVFLSGLWCERMFAWAFWGWLFYMCCMAGGVLRFHGLGKFVVTPCYH